MRRSLAPSQLSFKRQAEAAEKRSPSSILALIAKPGERSEEEPPTKRPFVVPIKSNLTSPSFKTLDTSGGSRQSEDELAKENTCLKKPKAFLNPVKVERDEQVCATQDTAPVEPLCDETLYFSVVWGKQSTRKHKKWEGDAILIVSGKNLSLMDTDGKEIAKSNGSKIKNFESGQCFFVGGKEVEIQDQIDKSVFLKGKCFERNATTDALVAPKVIMPKQFCLPLKEGVAQVKAGVVLKPRHDPTDKNAIVLPRPDPKIEFNNKMRIVDVVVDPLLGRDLRKHQIDGVVFMYECVMGFKNSGNTGCILADAMGLGKTLQSITLIWTLLHQGPYEGKPVVKRVMIVAPSSLVRNWEKEFRRWLGAERLRPFVVDSKNKPADFAKQLTQPVMIISYELFVRNAEVIERIPFDLIICDEAHRMKNLKVKKSETLAKLNCTRRVFLTGTPVQNDLSEFFALADTVNPGILGKPSAFKRVFEDPIVASRLPDASEESRELGEMRAQELNEIISQFVLRRTQETIKDYLPPKVENVVLCKINEDQAEMYRSIVGCRDVRMIFSGGYDGCAHFYYISLLRNLCNHPFLCSKVDEDLDEAADVDLDLEKISQKPAATSTKLEVLKKMVETLIEKTSEKVVIVSYFTKTLDLIADNLKSMEYDYLRLDGQTKVAERQVIVDCFNRRGSERIFLLSSKAGGVGLNLIGASRIILYDIDWNPANDDQAMARVWRDGQSRKVYIYRLLTAGTIEEKIFQRQIVKQGLSNSVVDAQELENQKFGIDELRDIFSFKEGVKCDTHDLLECECKLDGSISKKTESALPSRPCQLGAVEFESVKSKNMSHLLEWRHFQTPFHMGLDDPLLDVCADLLTFIFRQDSEDVE